MLAEYIPDFDNLLKMADIQEVVFYTIIWSLVVMSASLSSSIAEKKLRHRGTHTLFGVLAPLIYPAMISIALPSKKKVREEEETVEKTVQPVLKEKDRLPLDDLNESYFKSIYLDSEGNHTGPFIIDMNGDIIQANCIAEVHAEFIILEKTTNTGKTQRIRLPYSKITSCTKV